MTPEQHVSAALSSTPDVGSALYRIVMAPKTLLMFYRYLKAAGSERPIAEAIAYTRLLTFRRRRT